MNLKLEKLLTAGFAAALGMSFVATAPAKASIFVDLPNNRGIYVNDGKPGLYINDGRQVAYKLNAGNMARYPANENTEKKLRSKVTPGQRNMYGGSGGIGYEVDASGSFTTDNALSTKDRKFFQNAYSGMDKLDPGETLFNYKSLYRR